MRIPPGYYIHDVRTPWLFRSSHHIADPGTVRIDFDPAHVIADQGGGGSFAIATTGDPITKLAAFRPGTGYNETFGTLAGQMAVGSRDPDSCMSGLVWYGIDMVSNAFSTYTSLGSGVFLSGLQFWGVYNGVVAQSRFIGMPNDGCDTRYGNSKVVDCFAAVNGFYGGLDGQPATRNNFSTSGWLDLFTPSLTTSGAQIINCTAIYAANSGMLGGMDGDFKILGGTLIGNATAIEGSNGEGGSAAFLTQWFQSKTVAINDLLYVPGSGGSGGDPPNQGGFVYQYTAAGTTSGSGTGPTGTGTGITDGTATCQFVGYMPENGRIPSTCCISDVVLEGSYPKSLDLPWLGVVTMPAPLEGDINGVTALTWGGGNETTLRLRNIKVRTYGNASYSPITLLTQNGGLYDIDGLEMENCATGANNSYHPIVISPAIAGFGTAANNQAHLKLRNITFRNLTGASPAYYSLYLYGNINSYDIEGIVSDYSAANNFINIEHCASAPPAQGYALESGRIANCRTTGQQSSGLVLSFSNDFEITNGITVEDNRLFNLNSASGFTYNAAIYVAIPHSGTTGIGKLMVRGNQCSYAAMTDYPIHIDNMNLSSGTMMTLDAHDNWFDQGDWKLAFAGGSPAIVNSTAPFSTVNVNDNGIPGDKNTKGTVTPTTATWAQGDRQWRSNASAGGVILEATTTSGTLTGTMAGCTGSGTLLHNTVTYSGTPGTPPSAGDFIQFASGGATGIYRVLNVNTGTSTLTLASNLNANTVAKAISYPAPVFRTLTLS